MRGEKNEDNVENEDSEDVAENEDNSLEVSDYSVYTKDYPVEKRTLDYYWNIDTSGFGKNMFDGSFSVFGYDFNGKITVFTVATQKLISIVEILMQPLTKQLYQNVL